MTTQQELHTTVPAAPQSAALSLKLEARSLFTQAFPGIFNGATRAELVLSSGHLARRIKEASSARHGDTPSNQKVRFLFSLAQETVSSELEQAKALVREFGTGRHKLADGRRLEVRETTESGELCVSLRAVRRGPLKTMVTFRPESHSGRVQYYLGQGVVETLHKCGTTVQFERRTSRSLTRDVFRLDIAGQPVHEMRNRETRFGTEKIVITALKTGGTCELAVSAQGRSERTELRLEPHEDRLSRYSTEDFTGLKGRHLEGYDWFCEGSR